VLRRLRRLTLAKLRDEVAPVDDATLARFLSQWHGIGASGPGRLEAVVEQLEGVPLSFAELERLILPARIQGFDPHMLDELGALGQTVWIGCGPLGDRDGRIALYRREHAGLLVDAPARPQDLDPLRTALLDHLEERGASFFAELLGVAGTAARQEVLDALWGLVWQGLVTNDTFAPLRARSARRPASPRRGRRGSADASSAGRWSSVAQLLASDAPDTRRAHARALMLLERYGVVSRDVLGLEDLEGGFSALYPVYREMEEVGKLRRGHFADALGGAQFAFAGVVDRLRGLRELQGEPQVCLLAATDPANPYGAQLDWPETRGEGAPRRAVGASVVLVDGAPVLYLDKAGQRVQSFAHDGETQARLAAAAASLAGLFRQRSRRSLRIEQIDGVTAARSPLAEAFLGAGFRVDYKGLVLERFEADR
jgi:ATP-dependent Lhr-like helicase